MDLEPRTEESRRARWDGEGEVQEDGVPRLSTGIHRLDSILCGGFLRGGIYSVMGPPGSGKTLLGNQLCFHHASTGGRAIYVTLLAESHARMLLHIRPMSFFAPDRVGTSIQFVNAFSVLEQQGLDGLQDLLRRFIRESKATLAVIDGTQAVEAHAEKPLGFQKFLRELQAFTGLLDCTVLLLTPTSPSRTQAENTMVDGVLELSHSLLGPRAVRELTVHKFRGSESLAGRHEMEIGRDGMIIHPRTEVQFNRPPSRAGEQRIRMPFGIPELDEMTHGGIVSGSTTMVLGPPGVGKTILGLQFLAHGASQGQPGVYFGFFETPPRLLEKARDVGIDLESYCQEGLIEVQWQPPLEHYVDELAERLLERIRERKVERLRVFIDGFAGFKSALFYPERLPRFFAALTHELRNLDVTTIFAEEADLFRTEIKLPDEDLAAVVENILVLRNVEVRSQLHRILSIRKMRESDYDAAAREFHITSRGIEVAPSFESAEAILSGQEVRATRGRERGRQASPARSRTRKGSRESASVRKVTKGGRKGPTRGVAGRRS
ncbi:Circadian clock protein KaiC [Chondromyces apiculatus DSM 436]|uniref:non-specific serine/threonine protein kinase n=2 Tax=Chondromyces apiculatus TaxID=51 RepID=A0A017TDB8_9BACT|nr:Circadian clock protein KaiC [Chondromyces apiculatus DSM 436]